MTKLAKWKEKRILWIAILLEMVVLLVCIMKFFGEQEKVEFTPENYDVYAGEFRADGTFYIDEESGMEKDVCLSTKPLPLQKGVYRVELEFDGTSEQVCRIKNDGGGYNELLANAFSLHSNKKMSQNGSTFRLKDAADSLRIEIYYTGEGQFALEKMHLIHTNQEYGIYFCIVLLLSTILNLGMHFGYQKKDEKNSETRKVFFILVLIGFLTSVPLLVDYVYIIDDFSFHFTRISGIAQAWLDGQFPARMHPNWLNGAGYPVSIMYGDIFLWPMAILHLLGFELACSYKIGIVIINFITSFISYYCFRNIFKDKQLGLFGTFLYCFSLYRLYSLYMRIALGEFIAMMFLPIIAYGLWLIFDKDRAEAEKNRNVLVLCAGFSGVLLSHVLSLELACLFTALICILLWKRTFRKETFWTLVKAAVLTIVLNLWFLIPFLDYFLRLPMIVFERVELIQEKGLHLAQLLSVWQWAGVYAGSGKFGMQNVRPFGMGMSLLICAGTFFYIRMIRKEEYREDEYDNLGKVSATVGLLAAVCCLLIFPWDALSQSSTLLEKMISSIQLPYRFLSVVTIAFTLVGCVVAKNVKDRYSNIIAASWIIVVLGCTLLTALFFMEDDLQYMEKSSLRNPEALGTEQLSGREYLLVDTRLADLPYNDIICSEQVSVSEYNKKYTHMEISCQNAGSTSGYIEPSLLYYIGYQARDIETNAHMEIVLGDGNIMRVLLPAGYKGTVEIDFVGTWYWHLAEFISLLSVASLLVYYFINRRKSRNV